MYTNNKTSTAMAQLSAETIKLIAMSYPSILKDRMKTARSHANGPQRWTPNHQQKGA